MRCPYCANVEASVPQCEMCGAPLGHEDLPSPADDLLPTRYPPAQVAVGRIDDLIPTSVSLAAAEAAAQALLGLSCANCGAEMGDGPLCPSCGAERRLARDDAPEEDIEPAARCGQCGHIGTPQNGVCHHCGTRLLLTP